MAALATAMQGAQLGGKFGGAWGAAGGAVLGLLAGGKAEKRQNKATEAYNNQVVKFAAQDLFDLRRQQNVENVRTSQALSTYNANKQVGISAAVATMGAGDIIGSSAQALQQTLDYQTQAAKAETLINWEAGLDNYNTAIGGTTQQRAGSLKRSSGAAPVDIGAVIGGAVNIYSKYGKGQGSQMIADARDAWNDRAYTGTNIAGGLNKVGGTLLDSFKSIWDDSTTKMQTNKSTGVTSSVLDILNKDTVFADEVDNSPPTYTADITPIS